MMDDFKPGPQNGQTDRVETDTSNLNESRPLEASESTPTPPVIASPKKSRAKGWLLGGLVLVVLAGLGALAYWQWQEADNARSEATSLRTSLEAAQKQATQDTDTSEPAEPTMTTKELAEDYATAYKGAGEKLTFFTRVEKVDGDAALLYTKAEVPNAEPVYFVLKRVDDAVVVVESYGPSMSSFQAGIMKEVYGIDPARLGIVVSEQP